MEKLRKLTKVLVERRVSPITCYHRFIFSKTGIWPHCEKELPTEIKKEVEVFWKHKFETLSQGLVEPGEAESGSEKKYVLSMFPYPSGKLHMGHVRVYTTSDCMARFYRLRGYKVFHPMGWDAFGLPAENAAIDSNEMPEKWTYSNIQQMKDQLLKLGCSFDWNREIATCDPQYYRWTQAIFLRLFRAGLVYQEEALVNWDPVDQTVLANEQVDADGCSWRSGAKVESRFLKQWFIKTTRFSKSLLDGLSDPLLENWSDIIKIQRHWIGDCVGFRVEMTVVCVNSEEEKLAPMSGKIYLWMAQPELLHGISFIGVRSGHKLDSDSYKIHKYDKYQLLNVKAVCPITQRQIPVIVCDDLSYIKDSEFYVGIPCISNIDKSIAKKCDFTIQKIIENDKLVNSDTMNGLSLDEARPIVTRQLLELGMGGFQTSAKLRDWLISRQRYWGTPIPIIHCPDCGLVPVPENQLPVELPKITSFPRRGVSPLKEASDWLKCTCPRCGAEAERETDTMDTFVDSSWYFLRYLDSNNTQDLFSYDIQDKLMPVDLYIGGKEHADLHLYFARFVHHFLASEGLVSHWEPFKRLIMMGMVMGQSYMVEDTRRYITKDQVDFTVNPPVEAETGAPLVITFEKMSKSKHNGIDPQEVLDKYGTDTTRLLMLANFAPHSQRNWSEDTFPGILNWQKRIWLIIWDFIQVHLNKEDRKMNSLSTEERKQYEQILWENRNYHLRRITYLFEHSHQLSVAISNMQGLTGSLRKTPKCLMLSEEYELTLGTLIIMIAPLAPHFASELWAGFCSVATSPHIKKDLPLIQQQWPEVDHDYCLPLKYSVPGKQVHEVKVPRKVLDKLTSDAALDIVSADEEFKEYMGGRTIISTHINVLPGLEAYVSFTYKVQDVSKVKEDLKKIKVEKKKQKLEKRLKKKQRNDSS
ncbi:probable leucine--tRNA ligase, mitochondrial isoform X1 [Homarus americanus]|uniref:probable leucine--tRNA ligase, mitochondrial isoform X1 n=2 Tax=Homarus americanus TaxID=6706 RepID=UPI001C4637CA|nr:probable leucine--tRNA ligase, mitochondrial isoform X1 [Homarus americanus]